MSDESEFPAAMGRVARRELAHLSLARLDRFDGVSVKELLTIHGVGPKAICILREHLESDSRQLATSPLTGH